MLLLIVTIHCQEYPSVLPHAAQSIWQLTWMSKLANIGFQLYQTNKKPHSTKKVRPKLTKFANKGSFVNKGLNMLTIKQ